MFRFLISNFTNGKVCEVSCDAGFVDGHSYFRRKLCVCADKKFYDMSKDICVTEEACEGYTYRLDGDVL